MINLARNPEKEYDEMNVGQKAARIGLDSEKEIINAINDNPNFLHLFIQCLNTLGFDTEGTIKAEKKATQTKKDLIIEIEDNQIGISVKSSVETSFHQVDRRRLENWQQFLNMPQEIFQIIRQAIMRKARVSNAIFILEENRNEIQNFIQNNYENIVTEIFTKSEENLVLLLINNKITKRMYFYRMKDVLAFLFTNIRNNITFSKKGIVYVGDFISIQRKGGNSKHVKIPKTNYAHPGNDLQFKFSPLKFAYYIEKFNNIEYCILDYKDLRLVSTNKQKRINEFQ